MVAPKHLLLALSQAAWAWHAPSHDGETLVWQDTFAGTSGSTPSPQNWRIVTDISVNNELQKYTTSHRNLQQSGGETLQIVPWRDSTGWTSGRVESNYVFTPSPGRLTAAEAQIRFGGNSADGKKGYWPAFWLLGESMRHGTDWPACGEIDVFESVNGRLEGSGTVHCDVIPGGICDEPNGRGASVDMSGQGWHTWRVTWDRRDGDWRRQAITWYRDGEPFHEVRGGEIGSEGVWASLAHSPLYFILNMAIGGTLVGFRPSTPVIEIRC
ncbi:family 16 glycosylhydrolase [Candidatus Bathyarchaeota archaeon]|nr:family 16 glycosylhydrolase [Candidatus Bathyarchaeota archaeon]